MWWTWTPPCMPPPRTRTRPVGIRVLLQTRTLPRIVQAARTPRIAGPRHARILPRRADRGGSFPGPGSGSTIDRGPSLGMAGEAPDGNPDPLAEKPRDRRWGRRPAARHRRTAHRG